MTEMEMGESVTATAADNQPSAEDVRAALVGSVLGTCNTLLHYSSQVCVSGALDIEVDDKHLFTLKICHSMVRNQVQESGISITEKMMKKEVSDVMPEDLWKELLPGTSSDQRDSYNLVREDPDPGELGHDNVMDADNGDDGDDWEPSRAGTSPARGKRRSSRRLSAAQGSATSPPVEGELQNKDNSHKKKRRSPLAHLEGKSANISPRFKCEDLKCEECGEKLNSETLLVEHKPLCHNLIQFPEHLSQKTSVLSENSVRDEMSGEDAKNERQRCHLCGQTVRNLENYVQHLKLHTGDSQEKLFVCDMCEKYFSEKCDLEKHMEELHGSRHFGSNMTDFHGVSDDGAISGLKEVGKSMKQIKTKHKRSEREFWDKEKGLQCDVCFKEYARSSELLRHRRTVHTGEKPHSCQYCAKSFSEKGTLQRHLLTHSSDYSDKTERFDSENANSSKLLKAESTPTGGRPTANPRNFMCEFCGKGFTAKVSLQRHYVTHTGELPFDCKICAKKFTTRGSMQRHLRTHTGERPYVCQFCGKDFIESKNLQRHLFIHTGERPYNCQICSKKFRGKSELNNHARLHTGVKNYRCEHCEKQFAQPAALASHKLFHIEERPHKCSICGKGFKSEKLLSIHNITHSSDRPYVCEECGATFKYRSTWRNHNKKMHNSTQKNS